MKISLKGANDMIFVVYANVCVCQTRGLSYFSVKGKTKNLIGKKERKTKKKKVKKQKHRKFPFFLIHLHRFTFTSSFIFFKNHKFLEKKKFKHFLLHLLFFSAFFKNIRTKPTLCSLNVNDNGIYQTLSISLFRSIEIID